MPIDYRASRESAAALGSVFFRIDTCSSGPAITIRHGNKPLVPRQTAQKSFGENTQMLHEHAGGLLIRLSFYRFIGVLQADAYADFDPFQQHRELRGAQAHCPMRRLWPHEASALQTLCE